MTELDFAYISGNWRNLGRLIEKALQSPGCFNGNWTPIIASAYGYSEQFLKRSYDVLKCDPLRSLSWFDTSRAAQRAGNADEAFRVAKEGIEISPGTWLGTEFVRSLAARGQYDEALEAIQRHISAADVAKLWEALVAVQAGDHQRYENIAAEVPTPFEDWRFGAVLYHAWGGNRKSANHYAAMIDQHPFGSMSLTNITIWCGCGAPFDLDATPSFAARLAASDLSWPPKSTMTFPDKDW